MALIREKLAGEKLSPVITQLARIFTIGVYGWNAEGGTPVEMRRPVLLVLRTALPA